MVRLTDRAAMTIDVDLGRKATKQTNFPEMLDLLLHLYLILWKLNKFTISTG